MSGRNSKHAFTETTTVSEEITDQDRTCAAWQPSDCEGTAGCPPRCPRFVTPDGTAILIEPQNPDPAACAAGLSPVSSSLTGPGDQILAASSSEEVIGYAWLQPGEDGTRRVQISVPSRLHDGMLPAELARQAIAYAISDGASRLLVDEGVEFFEDADFEVASEDGESVVVLTGPEVREVTTPPGESEASHATGFSDRSPGVQQTTVPETPKTGRDLSGLFAPDRVAVVGASDREGSIGRLLVENLDSYAGKVVPVSARADTVFGQSAPDSLDETGTVDLVVVAIPPEDTLAVLETAGEQGTENAVVVTAGFEESGGDEYADRLQDIAAQYGMNVVGPNSMGVMSTATGLNASFSPRHPSRGGISLVSQSGAFITATLAQASDRGLGFRHVVSVGNKTVLNTVDYLQYLDADPETEVIAAYLEDIDDGETFVEVARQVTRSTPVVVLKSGRTEAGASAAASHTGSLAGDDDAVDAALARAGVLRADSAQELLDYAALLRGPFPDGDAVGVVTNAGGPGVLATDATASQNCRLTEFDSETLAKLESQLPSAGSVSNPTDVLGDADVDRFATAVDAVLADEGVDVGLLVTTPHPLVDYPDLIEGVARRARARGTPLVTCLLDGALGADTRRTLRQHGIANYPDPSRAAAAIDALCRYASMRDRDPITSPTTTSSPAIDTDIDYDVVRDAVDTARDAGRTQLGVESASMLEACGIDVPEWDLAATPAQAAQISNEFDSSVVLKVASPDIVHKVDVGGVRLDVDPDDAMASCEVLLDDVREARPDATIEGVVVQEAIETEDAVETVVGVTDSRFGPLVTFGLGGVLVEQVEDVAFELAPLDESTARRMIQEIEASELLDGVRGTEAVDVDSLVETVVRLSRVAVAVPDLEEFEVNPLMVGPDGAVAVDLHGELSPSTDSSNPKNRP